MLHLMLFRLFIFLVLACATIMFPWWVTLCAIVVALIMYPAYEVVLVAVFADMLYGVPRELFFGCTFVYTLCALLALGIGFLIRRRLTWRPFASSVPKALSRRLPMP